MSDAAGLTYDGLALVALARRVRELEGALEKAAAREARWLAALASLRAEVAALRFDLQRARDELAEARD